MWLAKNTVGGGGNEANKLKDGGSVTGEVLRIAVSAKTTIICPLCAVALAIPPTTTKNNALYPPADTAATKATTCPSTSTTTPTLIRTQVQTLDPTTTSY